MENSSTPQPFLKSLSITALFGFIFGMISFSPLSILPLPFVGLLLSIIGLNETGQKYGKKGHAIAITGIILNAIAILWFFSYSTNNFGFPA